MRILILALCLLSLGCIQSQAQTPEQAVSNYFAKIKESGFSDIGETMHPEELNKFRTMMEPVVKDSLLSDTDSLFTDFADPKDPKKIAAFSDAGFMNTTMLWFMKMQPGIASIMASGEIETLGHLKEGDVSHVVVRMKFSNMGIDVEKLSVISVKDHQGRPMMTLSGEMKGFAESLKRQRAGQ